MKLFSFKPEIHVNIYFHNIKASANCNIPCHYQYGITRLSLKCWKTYQVYRVIFKTDIPIAPHYIFYSATGGLQLTFSIFCVKPTCYLWLILIYFNCQASELLKKLALLDAGKLCVCPFHFLTGSFSLDVYNSVLKHLCRAYITENGSDSSSCGFCGWQNKSA